MILKKAPFNSFGFWYTISHISKGSENVLFTPATIIDLMLLDIKHVFIKCIIFGVYEKREKVQVMCLCNKAEIIFGSA